MKYLFLDDIRMPYEVGNYIYPVELRPIYRLENWDIVRNYDEFVNYIMLNGIPNVISFDHDLAEIHYDPKTWREGFVYSEKTGYDCAKWMGQYIIDNDKEIPICYIHSMNPIGSENIKKYLNNLKNFLTNKK